MLLCSLVREDLLRLLPKGGEVAEIGVAQGEFSRAILANASPRKLHLIDPWEHQEREDYQSDGNNAEANEQERRHQAVCAQFSKAVQAGQVEIHRAYSAAAAQKFTAAQFDWIYIDGLHSYDGVKSDLQHYKDKVKPDGLILGHDYANHWRAQQMNFGVVEAVNEFTKSEGFEFVALAHDLFPTYVLARNAEAPVIQTLIANLLLCVPGVVELPEFPAKGIYQQKIIDVSGNLRVFPSF
ncbi:MAG TPA: class I SAM-dependent methyltransferase [Stellaceae bacterium]